ncbi:MAG TPA: prolyl-tRNA synthetase associated domain-containing protein [Anaerolineales bacterium]|nr:prolyl-tRNA synthetase associated domain-containing protein [Anaerolineales bacterium]
MLMNNAIFTILDDLSIQYKRIDHVPVYTSQQARELIPEQQAASVKNLFLKDKKGRQHFLVAIADHKSLDMKKLASQIGSTRLSLASPDRLQTYLGVEPGAVSLLALVNDPENQVQLLIDRDVWDEQFLQCHPLVNTATLILAMDDVKRFLEGVGHSPKLVEI